ncbi:hypothetical protein [Methyloversatilis discipulorum]|uniref:hypothetical protein n=1 Tax=Methyloversatilis discipulorum TaxID=1119528 RepID=UPI0012FA210B|nr:hypothetical protein [Methyloversatilis discipulorum]
MKRKIYASVLMVALTVINKSFVYGAESDDTSAASNIANRTTSALATDEALRAAIENCKTVVNRYEKRASAAVQFSFWTATTGAIAGLLGSALSGHTSAVTTALLSGTAGVMNTAQQQLVGVGYDYAGQQRTRNEIIDNTSKYLNDYIAAGGDQAKRDAAITRIIFSCELYKSDDKGTTGQGGQE